MSNNKNNNIEEGIKVILVGESGTGKTSLINVSVGLPFQDKIESTSSSSFFQKTITIESKQYSLNLWDTIGQEKFHSLTKIFIKDSKIVILVYDIADMESFKKVDFWYKTVKDILGDDIIYGLCGNKNDLLLEKRVKDEEGQNYADERKMLFKLTSAKAPLGFNKFLEDLTKQYLEKFGGIKIENKDKKINLNDNKINNKKKCCK